jgi:hypothetical protein
VDGRGAGVKRPSDSDVKTLFALSCNKCMYPGCEHDLTSPNWKHVAAKIAHICGQRPGSPRHDPSMTSEQVHAYDNLILLCPYCDRLVDYLEPDEHPPGRLREMREKRTEQCRGAWQPGEELLELYARLALGTLDSSESPNTPAGRFLDTWEAAFPGRPKGAGVTDDRIVIMHLPERPTAAELQVMAALAHAEDVNLRVELDNGEVLHDDS